MGRPVIGLDFDNTVIAYDALFHAVARERRLIGEGVPASKAAVRDAIRSSAAGDAAWHALQTVVYGERIDGAQLIEGVAAFVAACRRREVPVFIVSHKTEQGRLEASTANLRDAATGWMRSHRFFEVDGLGFAPADVFFEPTRSAKLARIRRLGCTHFIDDLPETLLEPDFPAGVARLLYAAPGTEAPAPGIRVVNSWRQIHDHVFNS